MKKVFKHIWLIIPLFIACIGFQNIQNNFISNDSDVFTTKITEDRKQYNAGDTIMLTATINDTNTTSLTDVFLQLSTSYGVITLFKDSNKDAINFTLPHFISKKSGWIQWDFIVVGNKVDSGSFEILPSTSINKIAETYIGPPSIIAGGKDFTMLVATPTDIYDNLLIDDTPVTINEQRGTSTQTFPLKINKRIAWKRIFSPEKKGRIFATALLENSASRELNIDVFANQPKDFAISYERPHPFADGNQILTLSTSILTDAYNNIVTDGTLVQFTGVDSNDQILRTSATTINGIATAKLIYPDAPTTFKIKATIPGLANSQEITIAFTSILKEYDLQFSENNRTITVGPLKSYLGQLIPDGAVVTLFINGKQEINLAYSKDGFASFTISEDFYTDGTYDFSITALGIAKNFKKTIH